MKLGIALIAIFGSFLAIFIITTIAGFLWGASAFFWFFADLLLILYGIGRVIKAKKRGATP